MIEDFEDPEDLCLMKVGIPGEKESGPCKRKKGTCVLPTLRGNRKRYRVGGEPR